MKNIFYTFCTLLVPTFALAAPANPSNLELTALSSSSVSLSWQDNSDDETGFKIFRDGTLIMTTSSNVSTFTDTGLMPNTTYEYTVKSTDALVWHDEEPQTLTHADAINYCASLDAEGFNDWRLPEVGELLSIPRYKISVDEDARNPDLNHTAEGHYWSITSADLDFFDQPQSWVADLLSPATYQIRNTDVNNVLCVRGGTMSAQERFTRVNGIVYDEKTKLKWQDEYASGKVENVMAASAENYCNGINIDGETGWRVPNVDELLSIINVEGHNGHYFPIFETTQEHKDYYTYTTGTTSGTENNNHWLLSLDEGNYQFTIYHHLCPEGSDTTANIRCVKEQ